MSLAEFKTKASKLMDRFPSMTTYLLKIDLSLWVRYARIAKGAKTYGHVCSNLTENRMANAKDDRKLHPLKFFESRFKKSAHHQNSERMDNLTWQRHKQFLVPHCEAIYKNNVTSAARCSTMQVDNNLYQVSRIAEEHRGQWVSVDLNMGSCECNEMKDNDIACHHLIAAGLKAGVTHKAMKT